MLYYIMFKAIVGNLLFGSLFYCSHWCAQYLLRSFEYISAIKIFSRGNPVNHTYYILQLLVLRVVPETFS